MRCRHSGYGSMEVWRLEVWRSTVGVATRRHKGQEVVAPLQIGRVGTWRHVGLETRCGRGNVES